MHREGDVGGERVRVLELYEFRYKPVAAASGQEILSLLEHGSGSFNIGLSKARLVGDHVVVDDSIRVPTPRDLEDRLKPDMVYYYHDGTWRPAEDRARGYARLFVRWNGPPTLELDGIHMHRIKNTDPLNDTLAKVRAARIRPGMRVLDTCMGLGYTAIASYRRGASVVTVEVDDRVLRLASVNPWSRDLGATGITVVRGDVSKIIEYFDNEAFDAIIHDPPRLSSSTGDLYGSRFYIELLRVLKPGGVLFHYTGEPGRKRRLNIPGRVASRLKDVGFSGVRFIRGAQGVVAFKPRLL